MRICYLLLIVYCPLGYAAPVPPLIGGAPIVEAVTGANDLRIVKFGEENTAGERLSHGLQLDSVHSEEANTMHTSGGTDEEFFQPKGQVDMGNTLINSRLENEAEAPHMATTGTGISKQQAPMVYYDEFLEEASEIKDDSLWEKIFGPGSRALADWKKQPIKEVPGYDPEWLEMNRLRGVTKPENLIRFRDRIGGMDHGRNAIIKVDPRDPIPLEKIMTEDFRTYSAARDYYKRLLGSQELERRMKVSSGQYDQLRIMKGWHEEGKKISAQLKIPRFVVERAGKLLGVDEFFTSFEDLDRGQALEQINAMHKLQPALYSQLKAFIGPEEFERRLSLLHTLNQFRDIKIPPKQLSAWQMQGLDVDRMVTVWAHSQPKKVNGERLSMVQSVMNKDSKALKKKEYNLFWGKTRSGQPWEKSLEHDQLSRMSAGATNYQKSREIVSEGVNRWTRAPVSNKNPAFMNQVATLADQERALGEGERGLEAQQSLGLPRPKQSKLKAIYNMNPVNLLRGQVSRVLMKSSKARMFSLRSVLN